MIRYFFWSFEFISLGCTHLFTAHLAGLNQVRIMDDSDGHVRD